MTDTTPDYARLIERLGGPIPTKVIGKGRHGDTIIDDDRNAIERERREAASALRTLLERNKELEWERDHWKLTADIERQKAAYRDNLIERAEAKLAEAMKELKSIEEKSAQTAYGSDHTICYTCAENLEQVHKFLKENENREAPQEMERLFAEAMKVIEPFAREAEEWPPSVMNSVVAGDYDHITVGHLRAARKFLKENGNGE